MNVLLVDDDEQLRTHISWLLQEAGLEVTEAANAEQALAATSEQRPTLVITDVDLGHGMDGFELRAALRRQWPDTPVLMISGRASNFIGCRPTKTDRFLQKPFLFSFLSRQIEEMSKFNVPVVHLSRTF